MKSRSSTSASASDDSSDTQTVDTSIHTEFLTPAEIKNVEQYQLEFDVLKASRLLEKEEKEVFRRWAMHLGFWGFLERYNGINLCRLLQIFNVDIPEEAMQDDDLLATLKHCIERKYRRKKLNTVNTLQDVVDLIHASSRIIVLTGAGNGIYSRLDEYGLEDPQQMFDLEYFKIIPQTFYSFAHEIYPSNFKPSLSHMFIKLLEDKGKLLRCYTQNIDTLEDKAGITRVVQCHGSFKNAKCTVCDYTCPGSQIEASIFAKMVPMCPKCGEKKDGILKPSITFFGEKLPPVFESTFEADRLVCDLMIVVGSSLKVSPVSDVKGSVPQVLVNAESLAHMAGFDVQLLGNCDLILGDLAERLGWAIAHPSFVSASSQADETGSADVRERSDDGRIKHTFIPPHVYLYEGAVIDESDGSESGSDDEDVVDTSRRIIDVELEKDGGLGGSVEF